MWAVMSTRIKKKIDLYDEKNKKIKIGTRTTYLVGGGGQPDLRNKN